MSSKYNCLEQHYLTDNFLDIGQKLHDQQLKKYKEHEEEAVAFNVQKTTEIMKKEQQRVFL